MSTDMRTFVKVLTTYFQITRADRTDVIFYAEFGENFGKEFLLGRWANYCTHY